MQTLQTPQSEAQVDRKVWALLVQGDSANHCTTLISL